MILRYQFEGKEYYSERQLRQAIYKSLRVAFCAAPVQEEDETNTDYLNRLKAFWKTFNTDVYEYVPPPPEPPTTEQLATEARERRNSLLRESDPYVLPDFPITEASRKLIYAYRQELRDVPEQENFPLDITWPEFPVLEWTSKPKDLDSLGYLTLPEYESVATSLPDFIGTAGYSGYASRKSAGLGNFYARFSAVVEAKSETMNQLTISENVDDKVSSLGIYANSEDSSLIGFGIGLNPSILNSFSLDWTSLINNGKWKFILHLGFYDAVNQVKHEFIFKKAKTLDSSMLAVMSEEQKAGLAKLLMAVGTQYYVSLRWLIAPAFEGFPLFAERDVYYTNSSKKQEISLNRDVDGIDQLTFSDNTNESGYSIKQFRLFSSAHSNGGSVVFGYATDKLDGRITKGFLDFVKNGGATVEAKIEFKDADGTQSEIGTYPLEAYSDFGTAFGFKFSSTDKATVDAFWNQLKGKAFSSILITVNCALSAENQERLAASSTDELPVLPD